MAKSTAERITEHYKKHKRIGKKLRKEAPRLRPRRLETGLRSTGSH